MVDESSTRLSPQKVDIVDVPFYEGCEVVHIAGHDGDSKSRKPRRIVRVGVRGVRGFAEEASMRRSELKLSWVRCLWSEKWYKIPREDSYIGNGRRYDGRWMPAACVVAGLDTLS